MAIRNSLRYENSRCLSGFLRRKNIFLLFREQLQKKVGKDSKKAG